MKSSSDQQDIYDVEITSRANAQIKLARAVVEGRDARSIFVEGLRLCEEAVGALQTIEQAFFTREGLSDERLLGLVERARARGARLIQVTSNVFDSLSDTKSPQGIALVAPRPVLSVRQFAERIAVTAISSKDLSNNENVSNENRTDAASSVERATLLVILHQINNPSNAGAMLRVAEAAGAHGVISTEGTVDLFGTKALRGAMGATFRVPLLANQPFVRVAEWCRMSLINTVAATTDAAQTHTDFDWRAACAVFIGNEARGLDATEIAQLDARIAIPMRAPVESLNAATALAVVLYEAARQRGSFTARLVG